MPSPMPISQLAKRLGYAAGSPEYNLLNAADGAGGNAKDGALTVAELNAALASPTTPALLSCEALMAMRKAVGDGAAKIASLPAWAQPIAKNADTDSNGELSLSEFDNGLAKLQRLSAGREAPTYVSSQEIAMMRAVIAETSKEADPLSGFGGGIVDHASYRLSFNPNYHEPNWVSYKLSAIDDALRPDYTRKANGNPFAADPLLSASPLKAWYKASGQTLGHQKPDADYDSKKSILDSFLMGNIVPQTAALNEHAWSSLELGVRELVNATGGEAVIFTGPLFLDTNMKPTQPSKWIGPDADNPAGARRVAVPTHCFKAVLLTLPNGKQTMFAFVLPNTTTVPTLGPAVKALVKKSQFSVAEIEQMAGGTIYEGSDSLKSQKDGLAASMTTISGAAKPNLFL